MAYKHREEIVGKRFLCVNSAGKGKLSKASDLDWRAGIIRAASHKDPKHPELSVLVEFDNADWKRREWIRVYEDPFAAFLVEETLTWHVRNSDEPPSPALNFISFIDRVGVWDQLLKPVEYLTDRFVRFVDYSELRFYQERDVDVEKCCVEQCEIRRLVKHWVEFQDSQRILVTTPSVLVGYRVKVYRAEGTTQWYTAVIVSYNDNTRELTVTDDTVLEEHNEDPCLVQMRLIGDGVVESILKGENVGITPRRRTCTLNSPLKVGHCATRSRYVSPASSQSSCPATTSSASSPRRGRNKPDLASEPAPQEDAKVDRRRKVGTKKGTREEEVRKKSPSPAPSPVTAACHSITVGVDGEPPPSIKEESPPPNPLPSGSTVPTTSASSSEPPAGTSESRGVDNTQPQQCTADDVPCVRAPEAAPAERPHEEGVPGTSSPPATMRSSAGPIKSEPSARPSDGRAYRDSPGLAAHLESLQQQQHARLMQQQQQQQPPPPQQQQPPPAGLYPPRPAVQQPAGARPLVYGLQSASGVLGHVDPLSSPLAYQQLLMANAQGPYVDMLWGQKMPGLPPPTQTAWTMAQLQEARATQERQNMLERERREEEEKREREKSEMLEREKAEKERQERHKKEEQERVQREAVQQHFEESLRLASQKRAGWSPIASLPYSKAAVSTSSSSVITQPDKQRDKQEMEHHEKYSLEARMRHATDQERWMNIVQQQQQRLEIPSQASTHHRISHNELKPKLEIPTRSSPKTNQMLPGSSLSQKVGSSVPSTSSVTVATSKGEPSFNLYGYQPFSQMYITPAQLKAREESKSHHSQPIVNRQPLVSSPSHLPRIEKDLRFDRSTAPGGQRGSPKPPVKDRVSPAMSTPGTFRPYEYNSAGPAPAHQGSLSRCPTNFPQEEAQNLVKCSRSRQDSPLSTPSPGPGSYSSTSSNSSQSAKASQPYSYNLIQQGLVPNPIYTPATPTTQGSKLHPPGVLQSSPTGQSSPQSSAQYLRSVPGITTGTPVCRPGQHQEPKLSYGSMHGRPVPQSRSPSMHLPPASSTPPRLTPPLPQPLNLQQGALSPGKRKAAREPEPAKLPRLEESPSPVHCSVPAPVATPPTGAMAPETASPLVSLAATTSVQLTAATPISSPQQDTFRPFSAVTPQQQQVPPAQQPQQQPQHQHPQPQHPQHQPQQTQQQPPLSSSSSQQPPSQPSLQQQSTTSQDSYQAFYKKGRTKARPPNAPSPASGEDSKPGSVGGGSSIVHESDSDTRVTPSPAPSTCTTISNSSSNHTKLKKAWLQRHSEIEDKKPHDGEARLDGSSACASPAKQEPVSIKTTINGHDTEAGGSMRDDCSSSSASEAEKPAVSRKTRTTRKRGVNRDKCGSKRQRGNSESNSDAAPEEICPKKEEKQEMISRRRGRRPKGMKHDTADELATVPRKKQARSAEKPTIAQLKKSGKPFLQDASCYDVAPKLPKCRECRMTPNQRNKKMPNIFCRFYAFRKLRFGKNGTVLSGGFSEPTDASEEDLKLWLPPLDHTPKDLDVTTAKIILSHVGDQFCDLVEQEREAQSLHMGEDKTISWKRVVQGVREMCDVCETTLFNIHWVCHKCGFVVCIDCYKAKKNGTVKAEDTPPKDRDEFQWLLCANRQPHEQDKLMMTQIIASTALWDVSQDLHRTRHEWNIPSYCGCGLCNSDGDCKKNSSNGLCKQLMSAVNKCFSSDKEGTAVNGETGRAGKRKKQPVNGVANTSSDEVGGSYSSDSGGSPLSVLADVALHSSSKIDDKSDQPQASEGGDDEKGDDFSTLRELLIRPTGGSAKKSQVDEAVATTVEQTVGKKDEQQLVHFCRRFPSPQKGREVLPVRVCSLAETSLLYPKVPHSWLCDGKLLVLHEPRNKHNLTVFQEQWKRGQPVLVTDVCKNLNMSLWHPDGFCRDFGEVRNDLVNCRNGSILPNQPMRKFWEGFENFSKRMKDEDGEYMLLKLKDWPPGDDFSDMLPSRFNDLMKVLPLPEYTHRDGVFNLAGRLPECFVRPDLGPKMYNAYGSALYPNKGTTNLHLDVSDAVNVMVYVGIPKDGKDEEHINAALKAIDEGACDALTRKRVREKNAKPGALWHIYNARDADKIRDLLNKVALERGEKLEPHHDPIHDQSWYLDHELRERLFREYAVEGYAVAQCLGEAVFIPAGAPHQVRNLHSCIKVAEDFVSPENIAHCFSLTNEFRQLSDTHTNHEDKLQIKNVIYHAVKDALVILRANSASNPNKK
ncbi:probable JmjC domain-containing histone demethylation protein 2C isoform X2 [Rhipicephalus sanguineus]|uniref:probable JmjC domain-containing histone demethylation protein 2C isoform X2 n=1 Tax=Rhipicephalus sanguineus TaxID=34632 RepID=UPI001894F9C9|nr:probable JmjC domain-containing histone demethylation protein 2C isoform X2 [Rhipicephalus sanguineus]